MAVSEWPVMQHGKECFVFWGRRPFLPRAAGGPPGPLRMWHVGRACPLLGRSFLSSASVLACFTTWHTPWRMHRPISTTVLYARVVRSARSTCSSWTGYRCRRSHVGPDGHIQAWRVQPKTGGAGILGDQAEYFTFGCLWSYVSKNVGFVTRFF
jgi:hypothetical protein